MPIEVLPVPALPWAMTAPGKMRAATSTPAAIDRVIIGVLLGSVDNEGETRRVPQRRCAGKATVGPRQEKPAGVNRRAPDRRAVSFHLMANRQRQFGGVINCETQHVGIDTECLDFEAIVGGYRLPANGIGQLIREDRRDDLHSPAQVADVDLDVEILERQRIAPGLDIVLDDGWRR
jgi:hypothetical protein